MLSLDWTRPLQTTGKLPARLIGEMLNGMKVVEIGTANYSYVRIFDNAGNSQNVQHQKLENIPEQELIRTKWTFLHLPSCSQLETKTKEELLSKWYKTPYNNILAEITYKGEQPISVRIESK